MHGVLGIHVDDGIGGGDSYFTQTIEKLRKIYSFGSYDEVEFTFTGIHFRQWDDGSVEQDQIAYVEREFSLSTFPVNADRISMEL